MVHKGQRLAQVDPAPYRAALDQAQGTLARDQALLAAAQGRPRPLPDAAQAGLDRPPDGRHPGGAGQAVRRHGRDRSRRGQRGAGQPRLHDRSSRRSSGRVGLRGVDVGNYVTSGRHDRHRRHHPGRADRRAVHPAAGPRARGSGAAAGRSGAAGDGAVSRDGGTALATGRFLTLDNLIDTTTGTVQGQGALRQRATARCFPTSSSMPACCSTR